MKIIDLHCDLLGCVEHNKKLNFNSPETNCSLPQLAAGGVELQIMAVAAITRPGSSEVGKRQIELYRELKRVAKLETLIAIENASALAEEDDPLETAFHNLSAFAKVEKILYVSLTWNEENRFAGGNASKVGLKRDGELLLELCAELGIAIDLSHTSDHSAHDILNYIDKKGLEIGVIASHSNFRAIKEIPRNLPDPIAKEIIHRGGLIGINFVRRFVGDRSEDFVAHIEHGLSLGGENTLCLGADFYGGIEDITASIPGIQFPTFQNGFSNSSCYPAFLEIVPEAMLEKIAFQNALTFMGKRR